MPMRAPRILAIAAIVVGWLATGSAALACSPVQNPTIEALGPAQLVLVGTTGDRVETGRLFFVDRAFNGDVPTSPIVIAFQEGEPVGDCSYPVAAGTRLIIAPEMGPGGGLSANLATLQADPASESGRRYLGEAERLFGPGSAPRQVARPTASQPLIVVVLFIAIGAALVAGVVVGVATVLRRLRRSED